MTHGDDIRDLLGRYATGPLTSAERERLFDAALSDQDLFEELAREQEFKMLLDQPGARDRMIRALRAPARRGAWILSTAVVTALSIALVAFLLRPSSKPPQIAIATAPPAPAVAVSEPAPVPEPVATPSAAKRPESPVAQPSTDAIKK